MEGKLFDLDGNLVSELESVSKLLEYLGVSGDADAYKESSPHELFKKGYIWILCHSYVRTQIYPYDKLYDSHYTKAVTTCPSCRTSYDLKKIEDRKRFEREYVTLTAPTPGVYIASYHIICHKLTQLIHPNSIYWRPCPEISCYLTLMNDVIYSYHMSNDPRLRPIWSDAAEVEDWSELADNLGLTIGDNYEEWEERLREYIKGDV